MFYIGESIVVRGRILMVRFALVILAGGLADGVPYQHF